MTRTTTLFSTGLIASLSVIASISSVSAEDVDFQKEILPILEERCMGCHRATYTDPKTERTKKAKSGYRMDQASTIAGAGDENEANIVAGKADESPFYQYTTLGEDDDWIMPPKGDPLTKEQQELLKKWINEGANMGDWEETKFNPDGTKAE